MYFVVVFVVVRVAAVFLQTIVVVAYVVFHISCCCMTNISCVWTCICCCCTIICDWPVNHYDVIVVIVSTIFIVVKRLTKFCERDSAEGSLDRTLLLLFCSCCSLPIFLVIYCGIVRDKQQYAFMWKITEYLLGGAATATATTLIIIRVYSKGKGIQQQQMLTRLQIAVCR